MTAVKKKGAVGSENMLKEQYSETYQEIIRLQQVLKQKNLTAQANQESNKTSSKRKVRHRKSSAGGCPSMMSRLRKHAVQPEETCDPPQVELSEGSKKILKQAGLDAETFFDRIQHRDHKIQSELSTIRHKIIDEEERQMQSAPKINEKSRKLCRSVNDMLEWERKRTEKVERLRREQRDREEETLSASKTKLSRGSTCILNQESRKSDTSTNVIERLQEMGQKYQSRLEDATKKCNHEHPFHPHIDNHSRNLARQGSASERLYNLAKQHKVKLEEKTRNVLEQAAYDSKTGERLHNPRINRKSEKIRYDVPIVERMSAMAIEYSRKKEKLRKQEEDQVKMMQNKKKIDGKSAKICEKLKHQGRLLRNNYQKAKAMPCEAKSTSDDSEHTRRVSREEANLLYRRQSAWNLQRQEKTIQLRKEQEEREMKECQSNLRLSDFDFDFESRPSDINSSFYKKSIKWAQQREKKILKDQKQRSIQELDECTFRPTIHGMPSYPSETESDESSQIEPSEPDTAARYSAAGDDRILPDGWDEYTTDEGFLYYYDHRTNRTQWTFPEY